MALDASSCRTINIILRVLQLILGFISTGIVSYNITGKSYGNHLYMSSRQEIVSFVVICSAYLTPTFLLLVSTIHRESAEHIRKTIFEIIYNVFGAVTQFFSAVAMMVAANQYIPLFNGSTTPYFVAGAFAMINAALYGSAIFVAFMAKKAV